MRKLIIDGGGYKTYLELNPLELTTHQGWTNLRIITVWEGARQGLSEQVKLDINLDQEALTNLKEAINEV